MNGEAIRNKFVYAEIYEVAVSAPCKGSKLQITKNNSLSNSSVLLLTWSASPAFIARLCWGRSSVA